MHDIDNQADPRRDLGPRKTIPTGVLLTELEAEAAT